ncbi:hypothetical protein B9G54_01600 [Alloscardovia macacae]|uniref:HNH nuclease domain-containing protein n=1 Tax=Alloscardovia macacae TaxID=1160091 RepID=A0A1Y2SYA7_9BIFI|nr:HNH endonuclease signature motif containing protein [Alloscardovia macacae]OTA27241.1 hypothetical protein B9G54_01600 [Alloscardovia macacae]OTA29251.1 hypothetical protein B9T39_03795 [Alloscardovia macacae]
MNNPRRLNSARRNKLRARVLATYTHCHLCGKPVDKSLAGTVLPGAPEVDEIIPVSRGGNPYAFENCQLAHRACNRLKSNHTTAWARARLAQQPPELGAGRVNETSMW